jgi:hypothetical protein
MATESTSSIRTDCTAKNSIVLHREKRTMTPLELLKTALFEQLTIIPRALLPVEVKDMKQDILVSGHPIQNIIVFPLPLPKWNVDLNTPSHVVRTWAWEMEGSVVFLVDLPEENQGENLVEKIPTLNSRADLSGRFYQAVNIRTYYLNSQTIFCRDDVDDGSPVSLLTVKAAREAASRLIMYSLAGVVRDLSLSLHLVVNNLGVYL